MGTLWRALEWEMLVVAHLEYFTDDLYIFIFFIYFMVLLL
jgi:hypothetical protein